MNKKLGLFLFTIICLVSVGNSQSLKKLFGTKNDTTKNKSTQKGKSILDLIPQTNSGLSSIDVAAGLKEALSKGVEKGTAQLSAPDGFLANAAVKILLPSEAKKVEATLRSAGFGKQVDQAITSMNRAAEDAAKSAAPIFLQAVKNMSFADAIGILKGGDTAATAYLRKLTLVPLTNAFRPVVDSSLAKTDAKKYWNKLFSTYNMFSKEKINTDLSGYVTEKATAGIFLQLAQEEINIRKNPAARTSDLLKKVFNNK